MGLAYYIVLESSVAGLDTSMGGKFLAQGIEDLDWTAKEMGFRPLSEFVSTSPEAAKDLLGEHDDQLPSLPPVQYFDPQQGLKLVQALLREVAAWPPGIKDTAGMLTDLAACERILRVAVQHNVRWRFEMDF
jgi:hypothetical protein